MHTSCGGTRVTATAGALHVHAGADLDRPGTARGGDGADAPGLDRSEDQGTDTGLAVSCYRARQGIWDPRPGRYRALSAERSVDNRGQARIAILYGRHLSAQGRIVAAAGCPRCL